MMLRCEWDGCGANFPEQDIVAHVGEHIKATIGNAQGTAGFFSGDNRRYRGSKQMQNEQLQHPGEDNIPPEKHYHWHHHHHHHFLSSPGALLHHHTGHSHRHVPTDNETLDEIDPVFATPHFQDVVQFEFTSNNNTEVAEDADPIHCPIRCCPCSPVPPFHCPSDDTTDAQCYPTASAESDVWMAEWTILGDCEDCAGCRNNPSESSEMGVPPANTASALCASHQSKTLVNDDDSDTALEDNSSEPSETPSTVAETTNASPGLWPAPTFSTIPSSPINFVETAPDPNPALSCHWSSCNFSNPFLPELLQHIANAHTGGSITSLVNSLSLEEPPARPENTSCLWEGCHNSFPNVADLTSHISETHVGWGNSGYMCSWKGCERQKDFAQRNKIMRHMAAHTGDRPYGCSGCDSTFSDQSSLLQHQKLHAYARPHLCPHCDSSFPTAAALTAHIRTHTGDKPFSCRECGKSFADRSNLRKHEKTHTGERPFACPHPDCGRRFSRLEQLRRHERTHAPKMPHVCPFEGCGRLFKTEGALSNHVKVHRAFN
ncbi:hypothetical protein M427DRAFT_450181 [Gonapodya prolifera JEL478]|uniref:C2H2-type domain-containing protein n=1 Tax=Gonapodya prolifera (strain JEL478) TaxID=1344416 RepID=A0A139ARZ0_GONPJ|nr:hypothetical protein M427DRAFT_450181 [Gonapodya prolifera JEL478]|eukprot:KXS19414.1 hypothetical protein M427DRAFT_450181 [Gonapodya prolifera JEL478]